MQAIQATAKVINKHELVVQLPFETKQGNYQVIVVFLQPPVEKKKHHNLVFSDHPYSIEGMTFSRSEIYGDDGR